jgi:hypothetical protein
MALTAGRWFTVYVLMETSGKTTQVRYEQSAPADDAAARASAAAMATDLAAITKCKIKSYHTYQEFVEDALTYPVGAEKENKATLVLAIEDQPLKNAKLQIPAPVDGIFVDSEGGNYDVIDVADVDLLAFVANFTTEELFYVSDGEQAEKIIGGGRSHSANSSS